MGQTGDHCPKELPESERGRDTGSQVTLCRVEGQAQLVQSWAPEGQDLLCGLQQSEAAHRKARLVWA